MLNKNIHLIVGPSSCGKSTYIKELNKDLGYQVIMAHELKHNSDLKQDCIVHYNAFRPFNNSVEHLNNQFLEDEALRILLQEENNLTVHFLVVNKSTLIKRIVLRKNVEPLFKKIFRKKYPSNQILSLVLELDYNKFYENWFSFFKDHDISPNLIDSSSMFTELPSIGAAREILKENKKENYSKEEIQLVLKKIDFGYQKIELPFGLSTKGQSRQESMDCIFKHGLENKSLLDVGCAYGYFAFEAEKRKAKEVVGTELKAERFMGANIIKEIKGSDVEFLKTDIILEKFERNFDVVLLLNVIHHLQYPVYALKVLSEICNELMILEYPTIADKKFQATLNTNYKDEEPPLIGVSLLKGSDQTFLFNDEALRRILQEHNNFFKRVEFIESPFEKNRRLAFCYK